jgi:hypothetical protein
MQGVRTISPSPGDVRRANSLTLPLGGSRGTSGEGLISQLHPPQTMLPQPTNSLAPAPWQARLEMNLTLPLGGSRGTSGEGLIFQLDPPQTMLPQPTNSLAPAPWQATRAMNLTLPEGGSRGTSGEGLIFQLHPPQTMLPQPTTSVSPPLGKQRVRSISPSPWEGREERAGRALSFSSIHRRPCCPNRLILCPRPASSFLLSDPP